MPDEANGIHIPDHDHLTGEQKNAIREIAVRAYAAGDGWFDVLGEKDAQAALRDASIAECLTICGDSAHPMDKLDFDPETGQAWEGREG
jgi:hypothetical protein